MPTPVTGAGEPERDMNTGLRTGDVYLSLSMSGDEELESDDEKYSSFATSPLAADCRETALSDFATLVVGNGEEGAAGFPVPGVNCNMSVSFCGAEGLQTFVVVGFLLVAEPT